MNAVLLDVAVPNLVYRGNDNFLYICFFGELVDIVLVREVLPRFPLVFLGEINVVVYCAAIHDSWENLSAVKLLKAINFAIANFFEVHISWLSIVGVN